MEEYITKIKKPEDVDEVVLWLGKASVDLGIRESKEAKIYLKHLDETIRFEELTYLIDKGFNLFINNLNLTEFTKRQGWQYEHSNRYSGSVTESLLFWIKILEDKFMVGNIKNTLTDTTREIRVYSDNNSEARMVAYCGQYRSRIINIAKLL